MLAQKAEKRDNIIISTWLAASLLFLGVSYLYGSVLIRLINSLLQSDDYSYGLLFPLVSAYIVYLKRPRIRELAPRPSWWGLPLLAVGLFLYVAAELAAELYTTRVSFVVSLAGLVTLMGGPRLLRLLAFPLLLLLLMLPLPELITNRLTLPLQLISSRLAAVFLHLLGVPVFQQGNILDLGMRQLQIVKACSGLRYILPLLALGLIFCYFWQRRLWKAVILLASLVPLAILANALRVAAMALYPALLTGFWHGFSGWLIFLFCLLALAGLNALLNYLSPAAPKSPEVPPSPAAAGPRPPLPAAAGEAPDPARPPDRPALLPLAAALALLLVSFPVVQRAAQAVRVPLKQGFEHFPLQLGPWQGKITPVDPEMVRLTQSHAHLNVDYVNPGHGTVNLWIAYYETQKKAGGFVHSPKGCLIASGWRFLESGTYELAPGRPVNYLLAEQLGTRIVVFYWYLQRGRWLTSEYWNKFYMAWDGLTRRRTDGALIRLITPAAPDVPTAQARLAGFAHYLHSIVAEFIPY
ncbi:MAG: VPLPA-CTERM-specific exosortase XrtD [Desulfobaccales bacterium]